MTAPTNYRFAVLLDELSEAPDSLWFEGWQTDIVAYCFEDIEKSFLLMEACQKKGFFLVGYISYDLGLYLHEIPLVSASKQPLLHFQVYASLEKITKKEAEKRIKEKIIDAYQVSNFQLSADQKKYKKQFEQVKQALIAGDSYQINLTTEFSMHFSGDLLHFFFDLVQAQPVHYSAFLNFGDYAILSCSPELFFKKQGTQLLVKPMKGTAKKKSELDCEKNRSENLIVVDLLRNDLSRIAKTGTVKVERFCEIESYKTLYQMTSTIQAMVDSPISLYAIIQALFPCGSVTGAPKKKTMEWIQKIENRSRGFYTGAIGYITPENDAVFNVAIRTLLYQSGVLSGGVGGGVTLLSHCASEWDEMLMKIVFIQSLLKK